MKNTYKIADHVIEIISLYEGVHALCREYQTNAEAEYTIETTQQDIDFEREKSMAEDILDKIPVRYFSDSYLEELAVYRKLAGQMTKWDTILMHGSAIAADGQGYLFTAKSGTGKSTHTRLWRQMLGERAVMINDDKPLLHISENEVTIYGTPWNGKHRLSTNISVPLKGICILHRDKTNHIIQISSKEAWPMLYQQIYRPSDISQLTQTLGLFEKLSSNVPVYVLGCNMEPEAAAVAVNAMSQGKDKI